MKKKNKQGNVLAFGVNPKRFRANQLKFYVYLLPVAAVMLLPIIYNLITAFKPLDELFAYPPRFYVKHPTLDNFLRLFEISSGTAIPASRYLFNTVLTTILTMLGNGL